MIAGVIGARVYHLFTGYKWSEGGFVGTFEIWKGGLSIWGAVARRAHRGVGPRAPPPPRRARAHGRDRAGRRARAGDRALGQLLQPGALRSPDHAAVGSRDRRRAPAGRATSTTRRSIRRSSTSRCGACSCSAPSCSSNGASRLKRGQVFALYVAMYTFGRIWFEALRIDDATRIFGVRFNLLLSDRVVRLRHALVRVARASTATGSDMPDDRRDADDETEPRGNPR